MGPLPTQLPISVCLFTKIAVIALCSTNTVNCVLGILDLLSGDGQNADVENADVKNADVKNFRQRRRCKRRWSKVKTTPVKTLTVKTSLIKTLLLKIPTAKTVKIKITLPNGNIQEVQVLSLPNKIILGNLR